jgi:hypothetical protein
MLESVSDALYYHEEVKSNEQKLVINFIQELIKQKNKQDHEN